MLQNLPIAIFFYILLGHFIKHKLLISEEWCNDNFFVNFAYRWQDRCLQIRLAAQELLVAELKNLGPKGRKHLVEVWGAYLPKFGDPPFQSPNNLNNGHEDAHSHHDAEDDLDELDDEDVMEDQIYVLPEKLMIT